MINPWTGKPFSRAELEYFAACMFRAADYAAHLPPRERRPNNRELCNRQWAWNLRRAAIEFKSAAEAITADAG